MSSSARLFSFSPRGAPIPGFGSQDEDEDERHREVWSNFRFDEDAKSQTPDRVSTFWTRHGE
jgi:hypothetical protein